MAKYDQFEKQTSDLSEQPEFHYTFSKIL